MRTRRGKQRNGMSAFIILSLAALAATAFIVWKPAQAQNIAEYWTDRLSSLTFLGGSQDIGQAKPQKQLANSKHAVSTPQAKENNGAKTAPAVAPKAPERLIMARAQSLKPADSDMRSIAANLDQLQLPADAMISFREFLQANKINNGAVDAVASVFYEAAVRAGLAVGERHIHRDLPADLAFGFDVDIAESEKDLTVYNPYPFAVAVRVDAGGNNLALEFIAPKGATWQTPTVQIAKETFPAEQIKLVDFSLAPGGTAEREAGKDGMLVKVTSTVDGKAQLISKDFYAPHPAVIARGPSNEERNMTTSGVTARSK